MTTRPNILILMADQMTPMALPMHGRKVAPTPVMDRLAEHGVVFDAAYCASPLCAPSRAAFMTGALPSRIGTFDNAAEFRSDIPTFAHYLRAAGYRTLLCGKMHFCGPDQLHGFEERLTTDIYPADFGWTPDWDRPEHRPSWYHNMSSVLDAGVTVRTNQLDFDEEVVFWARRSLYDIARTREQRPFCLVASLTHPHDPFAIPERWWNAIPEHEVDLPTLSAADVTLDPHSARLRGVCAMDAEPISEAHVLAARRAYYGALAFVDEQFGAILATLEATGLARDTIVILTSDHGEMLGERGLWYKMSFFEGSARVPLIVKAPSLFASRRVPAAVSLIDLLPTLAEIAGDGQAPSYAAPIDGRSLLPHLTDGSGHDEACGEYLAEGATAPIVMLRRGPLKLVHGLADPDQLYDVAADPFERSNLASLPAMAADRNAFLAEVRQRWDLPALDASVRASQRRRLFLARSLHHGRVGAWDFQPVRDAAGLYVRNHMALDDLEAIARFPRVTPIPGDPAEPA